MKRREFIGKGARASIGAAALITGACGPGEEPGGAPDASGGLDVGEDLGRGVDAGVDAATDSGPDADAAAAIALGVTKPPFVQLLGEGSARLRLETLPSEALELRLERMNGDAREVLTSATTTQIDYNWPGVEIFERRLEHPDKPGPHTLHESIFEDLVPGERYRWVVHLGGGHELAGSFMARPPREAAFRASWISDTMYPDVETTAARLAESSPDLILHGGDFQYMSNPLDTWNGMFHQLAPATAQAAMQICIGNHEYEEQDEFDVHYKRLFDGQGEPGGNLDYHTVRFGRLRVFMMNSEIDMDAGSEQLAWLDDRLANLEDGLFPVVAFHRPFYTFAKMPRLTRRDAVHPVLRDRGVKLVMTGHHHCYERFEVEGVTYVVDGGGGAFTYGPFEAQSEVLAARPEDEAAHKIGSQTMGITTIDVGADGVLSLERRDKEGAFVDAFSVG